MATKAVAVAKNEVGQVGEVRRHEKVVQAIQSRALLDTSERDSFEIAASAIDAMAEAAAADDLTPAQKLAAMVDASKVSGLLSAEEVFGTPLNISDVQFSKSAEQYRANGVGAWAIISATLDNGDEVKVKTGAPMVVTFLYLAQSSSLFPCRVKIVGKPTQNGTMQQIDLA